MGALGDVSIDSLLTEVLLTVEDLKHFELDYSPDVKDGPWTFEFRFGPYMRGHVACRFKPNPHEAISGALEMYRGKPPAE